MENLLKSFGIKGETMSLVNEVEKGEGLLKRFREIDKLAMYNQYRVILAFQEVGVKSQDFSWESGYALGDRGREVCDKVFAKIFGAEAAIARMQFTSGTHAISTMLFSLLMPGDELIYASGTPYDTIHFTIGISGKGQGSLKELGIGYKEVAMVGSKLDIERIMDSITEKTKVIMLQRAVGYQIREALMLDEIKRFAEKLKAERPDIILACDSCYGEFLEEEEPPMVGVDIMAGSLIKNPGGGIAIGGGYIAGRSELVERAGYALTCPGIGGEQGITFGQVRNMLQGLYFAPMVTASAIKGAILAGEVFARLGYRASPKTSEPRSDIIETIYLGSREKVIAFCEGVQKAAVIDSMFAPVPENDPGYVDEIVMASGSFTQGSSIELSADAPLREPYAVYFQGGLTYAHSRLGVMLAAEKVGHV